MQYTIRNVPDAIDALLRERAKQENKSINQVVLEALAKAVGAEGTPVRRRDLSGIAGSWEPDPDVDIVLAEQRYIDPELWS